MVTKAGRKPSLAIALRSVEPGPTVLCHARKPTMTANWTMNHAATPAAPQTIVPSHPQGAGWGPGCAAWAVESWLIRERLVRALDSSRLARRRVSRTLARQRDQGGGVPQRPLG